MKWIQASKRKPKDSTPVLAFSIDSKGEPFGMDVLSYYDGEWWRSMDGIWVFDVTHWMPLPQKPKVETRY